MSVFVEDDIPYQLPRKLPEEVVFVDFDFTALFNTGVTITIDGQTQDVYGGNVDAAPDNIKSGSPAPDTTGMIFAQKYIGGVAGTTYRLKLRSIGSDTSKQTITLYLPVVAERGG